MTDEINQLIKSLQISPDHQPVLLYEILESFWSLAHDSRKNLRYFDGTFGRGGHYRAIKAMAPRLKALVMDQDLEAEKYLKEEFKTEVEQGELLFEFGNFSQFSESKQGRFDMMLLDLGVSSPQLDQGHRGFSFYHPGPLDMRMNQQLETTAADILNQYSEKDLVHLFQHYGEIYKPYRVVRALVHDRKEKPWSETQEFAQLIERVDGWRKKGVHPATQYFMGLRLAVNQELEVLEEALPKMAQALNPGGRLAVISFHSLEDRIVKNTFKSLKHLGEPTHKKIIVASEDEQKRNSRSRSAKLRVFERRVQDELGKPHPF